MCKIAKGFKLCACHSVDEHLTHWKLLRNSSTGQTTVLGMPSMDIVKRYDDYRWVESELNRGQKFDFDYAPMEGDRLILKILTDNKIVSLTYDYKNNDYETGWRCQYLFINQGFNQLELGEIRRGA